MRSLKISRALPGSPDAGEAAYRDQWAWQKIGVETASSIVKARLEVLREPIKVAIVDWGIQLDHEAFDPIRGMISAARVILPHDGDFGDDDGHGTMLAGTIAGIANNLCSGRDAVRLVELLAVKFIDVLTPPTSDNAARAIRYAVEKGARIINASWDVGLNSPELRNAITEAAEAGDKGVLVVVAAGNDGGSNDRYPAFPAASFPATSRPSNMIVVMATNEHDEKPGFSNYGPGTVDIAAPGVNIVSTSPYLLPSNHHLAYRRYSGTSAAAAHVSGAAALLLSMNPDWKPADIRKRLIDSADKLPGLECYCHLGARLNLGNAL